VAPERDPKPDRQAGLPVPVELWARGTPLHRAERLGAALGFDPGALWVKRDDLTGLAAGGNKARKLEYLIAGALADGADLVVTGGAAQSNHVRMTAAAGRMVGLDVVAVVSGSPPATPSGNLVLDALFGVELVFTGDAYAQDLNEGIVLEAQRRAEAGRRPYPVPLGGSSPLGAAGYVAAAAEIDAAAPSGAVVYVACGTGGTAAGLAAGFGDHDRVRAVDVGAVEGVDRAIADLAAATAELAGLSAPRGRPVVIEGQTGGRYAAPTEECRAALLLAARNEGLVLDPVYVGKALAGLVTDRRTGALAADRPTVLLHSGGLPGLFADGWPDWVGPVRMAPTR
jgi:1-aminocyclopropane-1-carboxylate deaminase/D-cysteine desulfhydrase-like pyridoxal-dependent ACC family enzyme